MTKPRINAKTGQEHFHYSLCYFIRTDAEFFMKRLKGKDTKRNNRNTTRIGKDIAQTFPP